MFVEARAEPAPRADSTPAAAAPHEFLRFSTVGPIPSWTLSEAQVAEWGSLYPGLDVRGECRKAWAWIDANPGRRKTVRGMPAFLVAWFGRAVDAPRGRDGPASVPTATDISPQGRANLEAMRIATLRIQARARGTG